MRHFRLHKPSPSMTVALTALALSGTASASAALIVTGATIKDGSIASVDIANGSVARADLDLNMRKLLSRAATRNTGSTAQMGPQGPRGAVGATGPQGPTGSQGPQGAQGPAGRSAQVASVSVGEGGQLLGLPVNIGSVLRIATGVTRVVLPVINTACVKVVTPVSTLPITVSVSTPVSKTIEVRTHSLTGALVNTAFDLAVIC